MTRSWSEGTSSIEADAARRRVDSLAKFSECLQDSQILLAQVRVTFDLQDW